jgi:broad specificity phosphatase PhoE
MKLFLVRHGETDCNRALIVQGWIHTPLNREGRNQAHKLGLRLKQKSIKFDHFYSSDLLRAYQTAMIVNKYLKMPEITRDSRLREVKRGIWNLQYIPEIREKYYELWKIWDKDPYHMRPPLGESLQDAEKRVLDFVNHLKKKHPEDSKILITTHRLLVVTFRHLYEGIEVTGENFFDLMLNNTECHIVEI